MTLDEALKLEAGTELDALIARRVMGWQVGSVEMEHERDSASWLEDRWCERDGLATSWVPSNSYEWPQSNAFRPSTDIAAAWTVVEKLRALCSQQKLWGPTLYLSMPLRHDGQWMLRLKNDMHGGMNEPHTDDTIFMECGTTAPLAICRAALRATWKD